MQGRTEGTQFEPSAVQRQAVCYTAAALIIEE